ncbi:MAG: flippase-like domain-containing protein, partial [Lachnospiraceae bacterium]|nr:flippase-like domain-containing protein [Lachnospiraceae bacterium]
MGVTFFLLLRDQDLQEVWRVVMDANGVWIWAAVISMCVYIFCGGYSIRVLMMGRGSKVTIPQCFEYSFLEIFFSAITPSSTGGQPMQLRAMSKDGHPVSDSTGALIAITLLYKLSFLWLCGLFFLIEFRYVGATMRSVRALAFLGLVLNVALISFLIIALFSRRLTNALIRLSVRLLGKMHFVKNVPEMMDRAQEKLEQYHECAQFFRRNPRQIMKT